MIVYPFITTLQFSTKFGTRQSKNFLTREQLLVDSGTRTDILSNCEKVK